MGLRIATSLARSAQDPLAELTYAFTSLGLKNGTGLGLAGEELVALPLHPLQSFVRPKELLAAFERTLVDQVCRSGVDVNRALQYDHHFGKLQFVAGLGPRKAQAFRRAARSGAGAQPRGRAAGMVWSRRDEPWPRSSTRRITKKNAAPKRSVSRTPPGSPQCERRDPAGRRHEPVR